MPVYITEFQFGTADRALDASRVQVANQTDRGLAYQHYAATAFSYPSVIGICYSQWMDDVPLGRGDGENFNIGVVDITNRPYPHMVDAIKSISDNMYRIHTKQIRELPRPVPSVIVKDLPPE